MSVADETSAEALFEAVASETPRRPGATYRLQVHHGFRFDDVNAIVDYLADLGITDVYLSPHLAARPGSTHGYDVFDHGKINPEIGDEATLDSLIRRLAGRGLGRLLDIVPNHMGVGGPNRFWLEVLELGPTAPAARFFDIDWHPVKEELEGRVLLPILGDQYGKVLESGDLVLERDGGAFFVRYFDTRLPLAPKSYAMVLERRSEELLARFDPEDPYVLEYRSIWDAASRLPERADNEPEAIEGRLRERDVIKRRLARLCSESPALRDFLDENVASFRGTKDDPHSFDALDRLLEAQVYRLAFWRVAAEEINYRRFFDINDLAGLRTEDPIVFDAAHALILRWVEQGGVVGLRIDHPDGLADPAGYFRRLQEVLFLQAARLRLAADGAGAEWEAVADEVRRRFREAMEADPASTASRRFPVVAEKILSRGEDLPDDWPIDGTVGYEYLNAINGVFVDPAAAESIESTYAEFTGDGEPIAEVLNEAKIQIHKRSLASEVNVLARQLNRVSERDRRSRDFTLNELRDVIRETIAGFPVYRTYILPGRPVSDRDRGYIEQAIQRALRRKPHLDPSLFDFLREALLLEVPAGASPENRHLREQFVRRFQQTTGPVQAKGLEDTTFYRQVPLVSLNEVGADPSRFGNSPAFFHAQNAQRLARWPGSLGTTATHDTKRGEDTRIRIDVLSELADDWRVHLARWSRANVRKKVDVRGSPCPDAREEYLFYQVLLGCWPFGGPDDGPPPGLVGRLQQYMAKAAREAKVNTTWTDRDSSYVDGLSKFVADVLSGPECGPFLNDFLPFLRRIARVGVVHSLAQVALKIASPGVPDIYQGCEFWDLSLVDPDNRRPVDYEARVRSLRSIRERLASGTPRAELARQLFASPGDDDLKMYVVQTALGHRRDAPELYSQGTYRPPGGRGRAQEPRDRLRPAPRGEDRRRRRRPARGRPDGRRRADRPLGQVWGDTAIVSPEPNIPRRWRDLLTDRVIELRETEAGTTLSMAEAFAVLPVAVLVEEGRG